MLEPRTILILERGRHPGLDEIVQDLRDLVYFRTELELVRNFFIYIKQRSQKVLYRTFSTPLTGVTMKVVKPLPGLICWTTNGRLVADLLFVARCSQRV